MRVAATEEELAELMLGGVIGVLGEGRALLHRERLGKRASLAGFLLHADLHLRDADAPPFGDPELDVDEVVGLDLEVVGELGPVVALRLVGAGETLEILPEGIGVEERTGAPWRIPGTFLGEHPVFELAVGERGVAGERDRAHVPFLHRIELVDLHGDHRDGGERDSGRRAREQPRSPCPILDRRRHSLPLLDFGAAPRGTVKKAPVPRAFNTGSGAPF